jgi:hypothetical protein
MGAKQSQALSEMSKGDAYQNFATNKGLSNPENLQISACAVCVKVRGTYDLDKIIAADLDNRKINPDQTCLQSTNPKIRTAISVKNRLEMAPR